MSLYLTQICDGCKKERPLDPFAVSRESVALAGGWRTVDRNTHLCDKCITAALRKKPYGTGKQ